MRNTSLVYIENNGKYLLMHRIKKENDENKDKWIGIGGKFEEGESPEECAIREAYEETGLTLHSLSFRGIVTFVSDEWGTEYMHLFICDKFSGDITECSEGVLEWVDKHKMYNLPIWEGDKVFLKLIENPSDFFSLKLTYSGDRLVSSVLNGKPV